MTKNSIDGTCLVRRALARAAGVMSADGELARVESVLRHEALQDFRRETAGAAAKGQALKLFDGANIGAALRD